MEPQIKIPISGYVCVFDRADFVKYVAYGFSVYKRRGGVPYIQMARSPYLGMQFTRVLLQPPSELFVDHIDGNTLNNIRTNLRLATNSQNQANSSRFGSSGIKGVFKNNGGWSAVIQVDGNRKYLGTWPSKMFAELQYKQAAEKYFGDFSSHLCR